MSFGRINEFQEADKVEVLSVFLMAQYDILELKRHEIMINRFMIAVLSATLLLSGCAGENNK